jgi:hypothetical protein
MQSKQKHFLLLKKPLCIEGEINGNKQCKKEDNKEMQEVGKKTQKAFLCSALMKSYAFVICYFPATIHMHSKVTRLAFVEKFMGKRCIKSEFSSTERETEKKPLEMQLIKQKVGDK